MKAKIHKFEQNGTYILLVLAALECLYSPAA